MAALPVSVCFWNYDRTMPLVDGRAKIEGCDATFHLRTPEDAFERAFARAEYDITEISLSRYMARYTEKEQPYALIPVFPSRAFRHGAIFIRNDRGIRTPADLKGKRIGLLDFEMTAALVARGALADEYGVQPGDIRWVVGRPEEDHPAGRDFPLPRIPDVPGIEIAAAPDGTTINAMVAAGQLDGMIALFEPSCIRRGAPVGRLFPDWRAAEQDYFRRTGIFPIMHAVAIRKTLLAEHPWLARAVFDGFCAAKKIAIAELQVPQACKVTLPWVVAEYAQNVAVMGDDIWPYGFSANRTVLEAMVRWSGADGLLSRPVTADELFLTELHTT